MNATQTTVRGEPLWVVSLGKRQVGTRTRVFGRTKKEAESRAAEKLKELREHGRSLSGISAAHRGLILDWRDKLTVGQMADAFKKYAAANPTALTVEKAVSEYLAARKGAFSRSHEASTRWRMKRFQAAFAKRPLDAIIPGELESFLAAQGASARNFYRVLHVFFAHARRHRWVLIDPMAEVQRPLPTVAGEKAIFTAAQMKALLRAAAGLDGSGERHEPTLALFVLGGLCGLRYTEALRLEWRQVDLDAGEIHLDKLKTSKRGLRGRFVQILPAAKAWLSTLAREEGGRVVKVNDKNARLHRGRIIAAAQLREWPHNALRRSWGSYHLAAFENSAQTAAQMGHTSAETTFAKYRTLARAAAGRAWFALSPEECAKADPAPAPVIPFASAG